MRVILLLCVGLATFSLAALYPQPEGYINDFARVLPMNLMQELEYELRAFAQKTGVEVAVVTIDGMANYPGTARNFERFSTELFNNWGIGQSRRGNGILIVLSVQDRKVRIELGNGYPGYYEKITENIVVSDMMPYCKNGDYASAVAAGTRSVINLIGKKVSWREFYRWHICVSATVVTVCGIYFFYRWCRQSPFIPPYVPSYTPEQYSYRAESKTDCWHSCSCSGLHDHCSCCRPPYIAHWPPTSATRPAPSEARPQVSVIRPAIVVAGTAFGGFSGGGSSGHGSTGSW